MYEPPIFCTQCARKLGDPGAGAGEKRPRLPACGAVHWIDPKVAAGVLIVRDDRVLLVKRAIEPGLGKWTFPGRPRGPRRDGRGGRAARDARGVRRDGRARRAPRPLLVSRDGPSSSPSTAGTLAAGSREPHAGDETLEVGWFTPEEVAGLDARVPVGRRLPDETLRASVRSVKGRWEWNGRPPGIHGRDRSVDLRRRHPCAETPASSCRSSPSFCSSPPPSRAPRSRRRPHGSGSGRARESHVRGRLLLVHAGAVRQPARRRLDDRRLHGRHEGRRHVPRGRERRDRPPRVDRGRLRPEESQLRKTTRRLLAQRRPDERRRPVLRHRLQYRRRSSSTTTRSGGRRGVEEGARGFEACSRRRS